MKLCESCKNKTSNDQCQIRCLVGSRFCGKHSKVKEPRIWAEVNNVGKHVILIQKIWKGYSIRYKIRLAGPGAMNRTKCHNDEELITMEGKNSVSPLDYFAFEESDKVYWFHIYSIMENSRMSKIPTNPYTRQPLKIEDRRRMRELYVLRLLRKQPVTHDRKELNLETDITTNWTAVCQIIEENGFFDLNPMIFMSLSMRQLLVFVMMIDADLKAYASEHISKSRRYSYIRLISRLLEAYTPDVLQPIFSFKTAATLSFILHDCYDNYTLCFIIMSSLYRL
jgi:hypothetical protein